MVTTALFTNLLSPGVFLNENTAGFRTVEIASFQSVYCFGSAATGVSLVPTLIQSYADFQNQFTISPSANAVKLFFRNNPQGTFFFIRVAIAPSQILTVNTKVLGANTISVSGGSPLTYTVLAADTLATIASGLLALINADPVASALVTALPGATSDKIIVKSDTNATFTLTKTLGDILFTPVASTIVSSTDYISAIGTVFGADESWKQGFVIVPEAYQNLTVPAEILAVSNAIGILCSNINFDWIGIIDNSASSTTIQALQTEGQAVVSPKGHLVYYAPFVTDLETNTVPVSAAIAGIWTKRIREQGIQQPPAGKLYPIQGVTDVSVKYSNADQNILNPLNINLVRNLRNKGIVSWGMRTRSNDSYYTQCVTRVIMSVLNGTLRDAFDTELFTSIDGQGILLLRIEETAKSVCRRLWQSGSLFGETESDAFAVLCSFVNNSPANINLGNVLLEVFASTSPAVEKILVSTVKVNIGQVQSSANAGIQL